MVNVQELRYPEKSHRKKVTIPKYSQNLAEFFGIMIGDGGINNTWQANISVNAISDLEYSDYILVLCKTLFNIMPAIRKRKESNTLVISLASTSVVDFLVRNGLPRGSKLKNGLRIPEWVLKNKTYKRACIRGLIDTDGCVFIHIHNVRNKTYKNIGLTFTSYSRGLIFQVATILEEFGIMPHISKRGQDIYLYQADSVLKYLKIFGTSNNRIRSVYNQWRDAGVV